MTKELIHELEVLFRDYGVLRGKGRRFPGPVKNRIIALLREGTCPTSLSRATGISMMTLNSWRQGSTTANFKKIEVIHDAPTSNNNGKLRIYIGDRAWIELDPDALDSGILQKIRAAL